MTSANPRPDWDSLFELASAQQGHFTTSQAAKVGYSPQLLAHHLKHGNITRLQRGIYRLVHFPVTEHEELVLAWLWSNQQGVFSHQTALFLQDLSDILPSRLHLTLPGSWRSRRLRTPAGLQLHYAELAADDRAWFGAVPITSPRQTLLDCAALPLAPDLLQQALEQALSRGLVSSRQMTPVRRALRSFSAPAA